MPRASSPPPLALLAILVFSGCVKPIAYHAYVQNVRTQDASKPSLGHVTRADLTSNRPIVAKEQGDVLVAESVHVLDGRGRWPSIDDPDRVDALVLPFLRRQRMRDKA